VDLLPELLILSQVDDQKRRSIRDVCNEVTKNLMSFAVEHPNRSEKTPHAPEFDSESAGLVLAELDRILSSRFFKNAVRGRQFLEYVVHHKLAGSPEQLKERTIGTEVFHRAPGYATGEDPVVRVQAGEVRRRLEQYYAASQDRSGLQIELPVGSYLPLFRSRPAESPALLKPLDRHTVPLTTDAPAEKVRAATNWKLVALLLALILSTGIVFETTTHLKAHPMSVLEQFWAPVFDTPQPVLICVAKPVVYRPSLELYQRYARNHPGTFESEVERSNQVLSLPGNEQVAWSQMLQYPDYGVAVGDAYSAVSASGLLGQLGKPTQVRIGTNYSFEDLRNSPAMIIGAFNNKWTMQIAPSLHFAFVEENGSYLIREQGPNGREWRAALREFEKFGDDFGIVARLLDSKTGQFTVIAAGLTSSGTQAAGEFVSNPDFLDKGMRAVSAPWQKKNLELVLQTTVTDSTPGPPHVVASYTW
jgi:hypothetical protein